MLDDENKIFVIYIGIIGIRSEDIPSYVNKITERIIPNIKNTTFITIPIESNNTRIECINPKYITNSELINKHNELMEELNNQLKIQLDIIKESNEKN